MCVGVVALIIKCLACCVSRSITASVGVYCYHHYITPRNNSINIDFTTITYSTTTERVVGTWIDDKPIYCKIITGTTPSSNSSSFNIPHGITNLGTVLPMTNLCIDTGSNYSFSGADGTATYNIRFEISSTNLTIKKTEYAWKSASVACAIYYTKS